MPWLIGGWCRGWARSFCPEVATEAQAVRASAKVRESRDRTLGLHPLRKGEEVEGRQMEPLQGGGHGRPGVGTTGRGSEKGDSCEAVC